MYKVFVNECPIILTDNKNFSTKLDKVLFNIKDIEILISKLFLNESKGICLVCSDLKKDFKLFKALFKKQKAAGGKVINAKNEVLFIYRMKKWDLPKGKLEKGETIKEAAIREVEEECGINGLTIKSKLPTTYHIFRRKGKTIFKITHWYLMTTEFIGDLTPQIDEEIEIAKFKNEVEVKEALLNTYENIKLLF
ncbi:NUDIX domain-containing protein [Lutibacter oricola]|uniref:NUDIX domain-containing protein n=1 Tax=Lutibacter oricola TaxID=762486 RepID=A0A1H2ZC28_9FLAO|nr:NUDIX domain-containing protein [Lutibacter oricola]SDX15063.1 NUDIX domain-containing protein [Lutibacter oricola]